VRHGEGREDRWIDRTFGGDLDAAQAPGFDALQ
jgi:hypothetical protein